MPLHASQRRPELLAPAGTWDAARAAVANGADAVYFGLPVLNARLRAENFTAEDLPELVRFLHEHGVRAYATLNTLVFTDELQAAESLIALLVAAEVDAVIVQDLGLALLIRDSGANLEVHASTQMTITSPEGARFARDLGVSRVILARELSIAEISRFHEPGMLPLEVFVHGALCVAYSGQCLTSESLGQRSANRGECAQACRLPYELVVDGVLRDLGDRRYLLSPQDLAALNEVPELIRLGVASLKIEGRLKSAEYVAAVTQVYRRAIDAALLDATPAPPDAAELYKLEMTFSRGLYSGWFHGVNHQKLVHARFGTKRGPLAGRVARCGHDHVELAGPPLARLARGDGVVFDTGGDTDREQGGRLYDVRGARLYFENGRIVFHRLKPGDRVWKTHDPQLERELRRTYTRELPARRQPIDIRVLGSAGEPLRIEAEAGPLRHTVSSEITLAPAALHALTVDVLREQLGRLGTTRWELRGMTAELEGVLMLPLSELNRLRRELVARLDADHAAADAGARASRPVPRAVLASILAETAARLPTGAPSTGAAETIVLCRSLEQVDAALDCGVHTVYCDFEDPRRYREAVSRVREAGDRLVYLATPRIQKAGEVGLFRPIELAEPDGVLLRNLGGLDYFAARGLRRVGDFSLNVANPLTARLLIDRGLERVTASYDLNADQVLAMLRAAPPVWFEVTIHQHMPMFHMEHCVFAAFLSTGTDATNCGRPCDRHRLALRDRLGVDHPVTADVGCRNTVFNARPQSGAFYLDAFRDAGLGTFRVELLSENRAAARRVVEAYQDLLAGRVEVAALLSRLKVDERLGVTRGTLSAAR